ncbi:MAG: sigma-70 family RNA polymerase sigma factor [Chloroflexota bacterium]
MTWQNAPLNEIIHGCQAESQQRLRAAAPGRCYELFRRALTQQDELAWTAVQQQYQWLVQSWVQKTVESLSDEVADELVQQTFIKFWRTLSQQKQFAANFPHEGAVLRYLNRCTVSACHDFLRKQQKQARLQQLLQARARLEPTAVSLKPDVPEKSPELQALQQWLEHELEDPAEKLFIRLAFVFELKPREIAVRYPEQFPDAQAVYRVKDRLLKRARRAILAKMSQKEVQNG